MTSAVCFKCGAIKFGALIECTQCGAVPKALDELAVSLVLNDHFFDFATLERMGNAIQSGQAPPFGSAQLQQLIEQARKLPNLAKFQSTVHGPGGNPSEGTAPGGDEEHQE